LSLYSKYAYHRPRPFILLVLVTIVAGCSSVYYYQPGKTLEQCLQDSKECKFEADKHAYPDAFLAADLYYRGMDIRGYQRLSKEQLPVGIRTHPSGIVSFVYVAGE